MAWVIILFVAVELLVGAWSITGWLRGRRLAAQDRAAIAALSRRELMTPRADGEPLGGLVPKGGEFSARSSTDGVAAEQIGDLPWITGDTDEAETRSMSATEAGERYERDRLGILDELARLANVLLLLGVCGTLSVILLAVNADPETAFQEGGNAFLVTFFAVSLSVLSALGQHDLARKFDENGKGIVSAWAKLSQRRLDVFELPALPVPEEEPTSALADLSEAIRSQEKAFREMAEAIPDQLKAAIKASELGKLPRGYDKAIGGLTTSVQGLNDNIRTIAGEAELLRGGVANLELASKAAIEAGNTIRQLANDAATSREQYREGLREISNEFVQSMKQTTVHLATVDKSVERMSEQLAGLVDKAMQRVDAALATQVTRYFDQLTTVQDRFFADLAKIEEIAPGVGRALQEMEPSAQATVSALELGRSAAIESLTATSDKVEVVGRQVTDLLRTVEASMRSIASGVLQVHEITEGQLRSTHAASTQAMKTARWTMIASISAVVVWLSAIGGWLWWNGRL